METTVRALGFVTIALTLALASGRAASAQTAEPTQAAPAAPAAPPAAVAPAPPSAASPTPAETAEPAVTAEPASTPAAASPATSAEAAPAVPTEPTSPASPVAEPAASEPVADEPALPEPPKTALEKSEDAPWYEKLSIRGYTQVRYNRLPTFDDNDDIVNAQGDKYIGNGSGFGIRRARVILYGDVHPLLSVYLQTDFASAIDDQNHVAIVRDWYTDIYMDHDKQFRFRVGQSKVPFGFENLQSSQNRLPLDRNDALNSAVKDERDLGIFFYWETVEARKLFKMLVADNLKGSGDYGMLGLGVYNGQTANRFDTNDNLHVIGRFTYPFWIGDQILELGAGAYTGQYRVKVSDTDDGMTYRTNDPENDVLDQRAFASFVLYPRPFGIQAEYNIGKGPQQGEDDPSAIVSRSLHGGYATLTYKIDEPFGTVSLMPYVRGTYYDGGKKFETNAPHYVVKELEMGAEWQIWTALELTLAYTVTDRTSSSYPYPELQGHLGRVQLQFNY
jgi:hypothetical protein